MMYEDIALHPIYSMLEWPGNLEELEAIRSGIGHDFLILMNRHYQLTLEQWSSILQVSDRTLIRYEQEGRTFGPLQTEKLFRLCLLLKVASRNLKDMGAFRTWLHLPNTTIGNKRPIEMLDTFRGADMVISILIRAEFGVLS